MKITFSKRKAMQKRRLHFYFIWLQLFTARHRAIARPKAPAIYEDFYYDFREFAPRDRRRRVHARHHRRQRRYIITHHHRYRIGLSHYRRRGIRLLPQG